MFQEEQNNGTIYPLLKRNNIDNENDIHHEIDKNKRNTKNSNRLQKIDLTITFRISLGRTVYTK